MSETAFSVEGFAWYSFLRVSKLEGMKGGETAEVRGRKLNFVIVLSVILLVLIEVFFVMEVMVVIIVLLGSKMILGIE